MRPAPKFLRIGLALCLAWAYSPQPALSGNGVVRPTKPVAPATIARLDFNVHLENLAVELTAPGGPTLTQAPAILNLRIADPAATPEQKAAARALLKALQDPLTSVPQAAETYRSQAREPDAAPTGKAAPNAGEDDSLPLAARALFDGAKPQASAQAAAGSLLAEFKRLTPMSPARAQMIRASIARAPEDSAHFSRPEILGTQVLAKLFAEQPGLPHSPKLWSVLRFYAQENRLGARLLQETAVKQPKSVANFLWSRTNDYAPTDFDQAAAVAGPEALAAIFRDDPEFLDFIITADAVQGLRYRFLLELMHPQALGHEAVRTVLKYNPQRRHELYSKSGLEHFFLGFRFLARDAAALQALRAHYLIVPSRFLDMVNNLGNALRSSPEAQAALASAQADNGGFDVNALLERAGEVLTLYIHEVASINAAKALISMLGLKPARILIHPYNEVDAPLARQNFSGHSLSRTFTGAGPRLSFTDDPGFSARPKDILIPYDPYKYHLPGRGPPEQRAALRQAMGVKKGRPIIVASSPKGHEVQKILKAYDRFEGAEKPLLILAMRRAHNNALREELELRRDRVAYRTDADQDLAELGRADIAVLETMGELLKFFSAADLALVSHNRNLFEPASQGVPILYFSGSWEYNTTARELVDRWGAGQEISPNKLYDQMRSALDNPSPMRVGTAFAVKYFTEALVPTFRFLASAAVAASLALRQAKK